MDLIIGLDVGTTATKAGVFDTRGNQLALGEYHYPVHCPRPGWAEQDAEELWQGAVAAIRQATAGQPALDAVVALSVSAQGATTILLDGNNAPIRPAISWMDRRAASVMPLITRHLDAEAVYRAAGWPLSPWLPLAALTWLRHNEPQTFDRAQRICFVDDFIKFRLCGEFVADPSSASITGLFDVKNDRWHPDHLAFVGLTAGQFSRVLPHAHPIAHLGEDAATLLGLSPKTWVVNGAHDQICCVTAAGVVHPGQVMLGTGTAWVIAGVSNDPIYDLEHQLSLEPHSIPGRWSPLRSQGGVGGAVEWLVNTALAEPTAPDRRAERFAHFDRSVAASPPGANGLIFLPPRGRTQGGADGSLVGLSLSHTQGDIGRALMEGIACDLRLFVEEMRSAGMAINRLVMTGGATRSPVWPAIVADILDLPVHIAKTAEAGVRGAGILAAVGAGVYPDVPAALDAFRLESNEVLPDKERCAMYTTLFRRHRDLDAMMRRFPFSTEVPGDVA